MLVQDLDMPVSEQHFTVCFKCLRALSNAREIFPDSLMVDEAIALDKDQDGKDEWPFACGGSAASNRHQTA